MSIDEIRNDSPVRNGVTMTQVLALGRRLELVGSRITDLAPRGDLGLGLDPEGPVGFALVRGVRKAGRFQELAAPVVLSVFGEGRAPTADDADVLAGERLWPVAAADRALRLELQQGSLAALLGLEPGAPRA